MAVGTSGCGDQWLWLPVAVGTSAVETSGCGESETYQAVSGSYRHVHTFNHVYTIGNVFTKIIGTEEDTRHWLSNIALS